MPRIVRPMRAEPDGLPKVGSRSKCLGVREPPDPHADVDMDLQGNVVLNRKGLSVAADWRELPPHLIPEHLDDGSNGASGKGLRVFVHGTGGFVEGEVAPGLELAFKPNTRKSGNVVPTATVPLARFQSDLHATRPDWVIDES